jgi:hypothetical protein
MPDDGIASGEEVFGAVDAGHGIELGRGLGVVVIGHGRSGEKSVKEELGHDIRDARPSSHAADGTSKSRAGEDDAAHSQGDRLSAVRRRRSAAGSIAFRRA